MSYTSALLAQLLILCCYNRASVLIGSHQITSITVFFIVNDYSFPHPPHPISFSSSYAHVGAITSSFIILSTPTNFFGGLFQFPLLGISVGGKPTDIIWRRNGVVITSAGPYTIAALQRLNNLDPCSARQYESRLTVRGRLPGEYTYTVNNGDTATAVVATFTVEGTMHLYHGTVCPH